ncbi:MAG: hypothetical protein A3J06_03605 [Candidatus Moranbacteria bacterium RIFCSPLOWO2_02_FULL_48_19]|nr:MAG: hypothetical protein A3J06_03605 [Candidatus Moranbacteria bacterium RIFCSPLOWO2_02_FULL_48_19]OGI29934.1 MAG: hypothetical protein A3G09_04970 [Candidatus Moranbacteria bacterium RIFCSPLOWO2_12_FULL_48_12]
MIFFKAIYILFGIIFVVWQGLFYYSWHPMRVTRNRHVREILLNTSSSLLGWLVGYYLLFYRTGWPISTLDLKFSDLILFLIAFYGMNGELPNVMINKLKFGKD